MSERVGGLKPAVTKELRHGELAGEQTEKFTEPEIINGITLFDEQLHVGGNYPSSVREGENGIHVVEMANFRADYIGKSEDHPGGKWLVFGRYITEEEHKRRIQEYLENPDGYLQQHIKSLGGGGE